MQRGFTLIELLIVIAILTIFAALTFPRIESTLAQRDLDNAARMLEADLRWLQQQCVNTTPDTAFPIMKFNKNSEPNSYYVTVGADSIKNVSLSSSVVLSSTPVTMTFGMNGTPDADNHSLPATFLITSKKIASKKYIIVSTTGRIRISNTNDYDEKNGELKGGS